MRLRKAARGEGVSQRTRQALRWGREEEFDLFEDFFIAKIEVYLETLRDLARQHGVELDADDIELSDDVLLALRVESRRHAEKVVATFNQDLDAFLDQPEVQALPRAEVLERYADWAIQRAEERADMIAVTEAYSPHADATVAFFRDNDVEPLFDFGVHGPDDRHPECDICEALDRTSPHPLTRVVEVGNPHIHCRQSWAPTGDYELPDELVLGQSPGGIIGSEPLNHRAGGTLGAVTEIERLASADSTGE